MSSSSIASLLADAVNVGLAIAAAGEASGLVPANVAAAITAGSAIVSSAETLYGEVQGTLSADDQATVSAALAKAKGQADADVDAVDKELGGTAA